MKAKDYFSTLKSQAKITNEDYDKFVEAVPDFEVPDPISAVLSENFMTKERASADKDIIKKIKAEFYNGVDASINELLPGLPQSDVDAIKMEESTHKKLKLFDAARKKQMEEIKKNAPDASKVNEEHVNTIRDLTARLDIEKREKENIVSDYEKKNKEMQEAFVKKTKDIDIRAELLSRIGQIEFAKEYSEDPIKKQDAIDAMMSRILKHDLDRDEERRIIVQEIVNGVPKPKFFPGTNDQVTIDKLLETETGRYIKRNNADDSQRQQSEKLKKEIIQKPTGKKTLAEMRIEAAAMDG